jgi:hypothetical protein
MSIYICNRPRNHLPGGASAPSSRSQLKYSNRPSSSLKLFQSLEEFSATVEPLCSAPMDDLRSSRGISQRLQRCMSEIWSDDSCSTCDPEGSSGYAGPLDYTDLAVKSLHGPISFAAQRRAPNDSVVLRLSSLIPI